MKRLFLCFLTVLFVSAVSLAQSNTGNLTINVSDPSGVIPGASIVIVDDATNRERTLTTDADGIASITQLEVGNYTVRVTAEGRSTGVFNDVKIDIARTYSLNAVLAVGDVNATVEVTAGADILNAVSGELSNTVSTRQVQELPLNGRNPLQLLRLQAGSSSNGGTNTTINGQRSSFTNITRDGLNIQDNFIRANATDFVPDRPNSDDTGEFTVTTQNAGAEAGYGSSQIQLVTPRGANRFTGAAFIYNRNFKVFNANDFINNSAGVRIPFLNRNQFGGRLAGPIVKDKLFFFGSYEGFRLRQQSSANRTILTGDARQGIFTYNDASGVVRRVNLFSAPFTAVTGVTGINAIIASRILANLPTVGNNTTLGDQQNTTGFTLNRAQNQDREAFKARIDFDYNDQNTFSGIIGYNKETLLRPDVDAQQGGIASGFTATPAGIQVSNTPLAVLAWRYTPNAVFTNEVRGGWQRSRPFFDSTEVAQSTFLQLPASTPGVAFVNNPQSGFQAQGRFTTYSNVQDNATLTLGSHTIRFGGQAQLFKFNPFGPGAFGAPTFQNLVLGGGSTPQFTLNSFNAAAGCTAPPNGPNCLTQAQLGTVNNLVALLGGLVGSTNLAFNATSQDSGFVAGALPQRDLRFNNYGFYGADQWRISPELTINYGLRYDIFMPVREPNGLALEPIIPNGTDPIAALRNPNAQIGFVGTNAGDTAKGRFFKPDYNNFAPNVSIAYSPNFKNSFLGSILPSGGRSVIRAGFRISYVNDEFVRATDAALVTNAGLTQNVGLAGLNSTVGNFPSIPTPAFTVPRTFAANNALAAGAGAVALIDPNLKVPRTYEYNVSFQREIGFQTAIEVRYVGSRSNNLLRSINANQLQIRGAFLDDFNRARSNLLLTGNPNCTAAGCQPLQLLNTAAFNSPAGQSATALLATPQVQNQLRFAAPGDLANVYIGTFRTGNNVLLPNPNIYDARYLSNAAEYNYNSLQVELRRRFAQGLTALANYTLQKTLTNAGGTLQTRLDPYIDNAQQNIEFSRADYDQEHVINGSVIYELPFGKGKAFFGEANGIVDRLIGGFQISSIVRFGTGAPVSILDTRGTINRAAGAGGLVNNSARQTANSNLSNQEISNLIGVYRTRCGVFFINPSVIDLNQTALQNGQCSQLLTGGATGRGARGFGEATFAGQVFQNVAPGQTGFLPRNSWNGPNFFNMDVSVLKNIPLTERIRIQLRGEVFNVFNRPNFVAGVFAANMNINSANFGRLNSVFTEGSIAGGGPRVTQLVGRIEF